MICGSTFELFLEDPLHQIEEGVFYSFQGTGVCRAFWNDQRTFTEEGYQSVDQQWSDKRASWSSDYDPFSHLSVAKQDSLKTGSFTTSVDAFELNHKAQEILFVFVPRPFYVIS